MAISPKVAYPANVDVTDPAYPLGKARNVHSAGDGSGTPLEQTWLNDLWGFLQSLLDAASVAPSGTPDKVGASQYFNALRAAAYNWSGAHVFGGYLAVVNEPDFNGPTEWRNVDCADALVASLVPTGDVDFSVLGGHITFGGRAGGNAMVHLPIRLPRDAWFDQLRLGVLPSSDNPMTLAVYRHVPNTSTGGITRTKLNTVTVSIAAGSGLQVAPIVLDALETVNNTAASYYVEITSGAQVTSGSQAQIEWAQVHVKYNALSVR